MPSTSGIFPPSVASIQHVFLTILTIQVRLGIVEWLLTILGLICKQWCGSPNRVAAFYFIRCGSPPRPHSSATDCA